MAYKQLNAGEELVLDLHPHAKALIAPVLWLLVTVGVMSYGLAAMPIGQYQGWGRLGVGVAALVAFLALVLVPYLQWRTTRYIVTSDRVLIRQGVLSRTGRDIPLIRVNDVSFSHGVIDRLLRCGTLTIESAGERGQIVLDDIPRVEQVQRTLYELADRAGSPTRTGVAPAPPTPPAHDPEP